MRQLSAVEELIILGMGHRDPKLKPLLIDLYNTGKPPEEQLRPVKGRFIPMHGREILLYRESLPENVKIFLDNFERRLKEPYVNGFQLRA